MRFVEASLIFPLTCLIMAALIALMLQFYQELDLQIRSHDAERDELFRPAEIHRIRVQDQIQRAIGQERE